MENYQQNRLDCRAFRAVALAGLFVTAAAAQQITLEIKDLLTLPMTGAVDGTRDTVYLARGNMMVEEPGGTGRFFIVDMSGPLYIYDKKTNKLTTYLDLNGREGHSGIFHRLRPDVFSQGFVGIQFDPDYLHNGKFYTTHCENPADPGSPEPDNSHFPGLKVAGNTVTPAVPVAGKITAAREDVLVESTDTNISNTTFEGTAREILRVQLTRNSHPLNDMAFNPTARPGDPEWRVMYVSCGDAASGESPDPTTRLNPQRLDTMIGKIWRIIPDLAEHTGTSSVSENGRPGRLQPGAVGRRLCGIQRRGGRQCTDACRMLAASEEKIRRSRARRAGDRRIRGRERARVVCRGARGQGAEARATAGVAQRALGAHGCRAPSTVAEMEAGADSETSHGGCGPLRAEPMAGDDHLPQ